MDYGTFLSMVDKKEVSKVQIEDDMIYFQDKEETPNYYETAAFEGNAYMTLDARLTVSSKKR